MTKQLRLNLKAPNKKQPKLVYRELADYSDERRRSVVVELNDGSLAVECYINNKYVGRKSFPCNGNEHQQSRTWAKEWL